MKQKKSKNSFCFYFLLILQLALLFTSCSSYVSIKEDKDKVEYLIGVSQANLLEPWRIVMNQEIKEEAGKYDSLRVIFTDAAQSSDKQVKDVKKLLNLGIDLLIISPNDSEVLTPAVAEAYKTIPVIVLDRAVEGYDYTLFIGPDNKLIGKQAGEEVIELLGDKGGEVIEIQGLQGSPPVRERTEGFREVIQQHNNIKIVETIVADWLRDKAEDIMSDVLKWHPNIDIIFAHNDHMALGAYRAVDSMGIKNVSILGIDGFRGSDGGLQMVREGILYGTFTCPTGGKEAMQYAVDILNNEKGIPKKIILRSANVTNKNVNQFFSGMRAGEYKNKSRKKNIVLGFSYVGDEGAWRRANTESIKSSALDAGIELMFMDGKLKQQNQIDAIKTFIQTGVDVIVLTPVVESGWEKILEEAKAAGIPIILSDRTINVEDESLYTTYIGADFVEEGRRAARWVVDNMCNECMVNIVELRGTEGAAPAIERKIGFQEIISMNPVFKIILSDTGNFTFDGGKKVMERFLNEQGNSIHVVYAHNDDMALGAIEAIEEYGLKPGKDIKIISIDGTRGAFKAMITGKLNCTVECSPLFGHQLMKAVRDVVSGKQLPIRIITDEEVFTQDRAKQELPYRKY